MMTVSVDVNEESRTGKMDNNVHGNKLVLGNIELEMEGNCEKEKQEEPASLFRAVLAQFAACSLLNLVSLDLSLIMNYSTVLIADLHHAEGHLSLDDRMASWMGSMAYVCQPLGSLCSGLLVDSFGRRGGLLLVNIPYLIAWLMICTAPNVTLLLVANFVTGISAGLSEAPIINYAGEITQPHIRGTVTASGSIFYFMGIFLAYLMGTLTDWRTTAAISTGVPIVAFLMILLLPETPPYLISKGRIKDAEKSLCWLRGWVKPIHVQQELKELIKHHEETNKSNYLPHDGKSTEIKPSVDPEQEANLLWNGKQERRQENILKRAINKVLELFKPHTLRPLMLVIPFFASSNMTGVTSIRPYMVHVFRELKQAVDPKWGTVMVSVCNIIASLVLIFTIKFVGKRRLGLTFTGASASMSLLIGIYAFLLREDSSESWIPVVLFLVLNFSSSIIGQLPWILLSEVLPFRTRGLASGVSAASLYIIVFCTNNTYLSMEKTIGIYGCFWIFSAVNFVMLVYLYYTLLETEGKTLHDIERHFQKGLFIRRPRKFHMANSDI